MRSSIALLMAYVLCFSAGAGAAGKASTSEQHVNKLKQQLTGIPVGSVLEVKLRNKDKFQGHLGAVEETSFQMQVAKGDKIEDRTVRMEEVKSVQQIKDHHVSHQVGTGVAIAVIAGLAALIATAAATYGH